MKTTAIWTVVVAIAALASGAAAKSAKNEEGYCKDDTTCKKLAPGYSCVSVQTTRENTEEVKQCLPGNVCAGTNPGLCPSFSTWSKEFKSISSVCAYIVPTSKCAADDAVNSTKGTVTCLTVTTESSATEFGVIYGCVDYDGSKLLHEANSKSAKMATAFNYSAIISAGCVNPKNAAGSDVVCSGRGTCAPTAAGQMDYRCLCNVGYSGTYCQKIESNKCTMTAQCAAGKCDLVSQECKCAAGTTGNQCAECDPSSSSACNKHGACGAMSPGTVSAAGRRWLLAEAGSGSGGSGNNTVGSTSAPSNSNSNSNSSSSSSSAGNVCTCETGYAGAHCDRKVAGSQSNSKSTSSAETPAPSTSGASSAAFTSFAVLSTLLVAALN